MSNVCDTELRSVSTVSLLYVCEKLIRMVIVQCLSVPASTSFSQLVVSEVATVPLPGKTLVNHTPARLSRAKVNAEMRFFRMTCMYVHAHVQYVLNVH